MRLNLTLIYFRITMIARRFLNNETKNNLNHRSKTPRSLQRFFRRKLCFFRFEEVLVKFQLAKGKELDSADLEEIFEADDLSKALNKALDYLSYSLRTEKETRQKLAKEGLEDDIIETVVKN